MDDSHFVNFNPCHVGSHYARMGHCLVGDPEIIKEETLTNGIASLGHYGPRSEGEPHHRLGGWEVPLYRQ